MGIFSKADKLNPTILVNGLEIEFHLKNEWWGFVHRGTEFCSFEPSLAVPALAELDEIVDALESLKPEMRSRMQKGLKEWGDAKLDDGESYSVDLQDFATNKTFRVSWSDGASWGDLGVDFTIKDGEIVDESWGD